MVCSESEAVTITNCAKCILCGEHSILRGIPGAIGLPVFSHKMKLTYKPTLHFGIQTNLTTSEHSVFVKLMKIAAAYCSIDFSEISGVFSIFSNIPVGYGLGSSASLCACIAHWFDLKKYTKDVVNLAKTLENVFHKISSGLDVAIIMYKYPLFYKSPNIIDKLTIDDSYLFGISFSGNGCKTSHCIDKVDSIYRSDPDRIKDGDILMKDSVNLCLQSIKKVDFHLMKLGIESGYQAFVKWKLISEKQISHIDFLKKNGAYACKPTGSGYGCIISLWDRDRFSDCCKNVDIVLKNF